MATIDTKYVCLYSQQSANLVMGRNNPRLGELEQLQVIGALQSPINTQGFEAIQTRSPFGKQAPSANNRKVEIKFRPKQCNTVTSGIGSACEAATADADLMQLKTVNVSQYNHVKRTINRNLYRSLCESPNEVIGELYTEMALDLLRAENAYLAGQVIAGVGDYFDGTDSAVGGGTEKTIKLFTDTALPNVMGLFKVGNEYMRKGYTDKPILIGGTSLSGWNFAKPIFTGNPDGRDINRIDGFPAFVDHQIPVQANVIANDGVERLVSFIPGTLQYVNWFNYEGEYVVQRQEGSKTRLTILENEFDFTIYDPFCDDSGDDLVTLTLGRGFDLVNLNTLAETDCGAQDSLLAWKVDCGDLPCTDVNENLTTV